jgi:hypothetical protein
MELVKKFMYVCTLVKMQFVLNITKLSSSFVSAAQLLNIMSVTCYLYKHVMTQFCLCSVPLPRISFP